ncbi:HEAT repeat domain-containing protein [Winogradskyella sp. 4-2091]
MLFKLKLTQPSENTIDYWVNTNAVEKLEYTLKHGNYKTRLWAAEGLEHEGRASSVPVLLYTINDKIQNVSIAALNALEALGCNNELTISITSKRFNWVKTIRDKEEKRNVIITKKHNIYRWKRASKQSFDRVKAQLKKPIR